MLVQAPWTRFSKVALQVLDIILYLQLYIYIYIFIYEWWNQLYTHILYVTKIIQKHASIMQSLNEKEDGNKQRTSTKVIFKE